MRLWSAVSAHFAALMLGTAAGLCGQARPAAPRVGHDSVTAVADSSLAAGTFHQLLFGREYRRVWQMPIRAAVLELQAFDGGLKPTKRGGGEQTKSLRFESANGREWVFRTLKKDARVILPETLRKGFVADLVNDQLSHSNPGGALTVPPMLDALGVLHATPQYAVMPDDPALGEFRKDFGGALGLIEEFPNDGPDGKPGFAGSMKIGNSLDLLKKLSDSPDDRVDTRAFLTARLFDLLINDWDRHKDQWKWARFDRGDGHIWVPIPRDRDQAYIWFDGLFPSLARLGAPKLIGFNATYPNLQGLTLNGRELDRGLLNGLDGPTWDSIANFVRTRITDAVIDSGVRSMPPEYRKLTGERIAAVLKQRRDGLPAEARRLYSLLSKVPDIHATDSRDIAVIERDSAGVRVRLLDGRPDHGGPIGSRQPYFDRRFLNGETQEVRVYLHGGDDSALVRGRAVRGMKVRVIGGKGDNTLIDSSAVEYDRGATRFYDKGAGPHELTYGPDTLFSRRPQLIVRGDTVIPPPDFGAKMVPDLRFRYLSDLGLVYGVSVGVNQYGFRMRPYWYQTTLWVERGTGPNDTRVAATLDLHRENRASHLVALAQISGLDVIRYYGQGNETARVGNGDYFRVENTQYRLEPTLAFPIGRGEIRLGPALQFTSTTSSPGSISSSGRLSGTGDYGQLGVRAYATYDTRDNTGAPRSGVRASAGGSLFPAFWDVATTFGEAHAEVATYFGVNAPMKPVLALRVGGKKVWGDAPYFESAFLGGFANLRGFDQQRFAGSAAAWGGAELRLTLGQLRLLVPGNFGIHGIADFGRVWATGESSSKLHRAFGGGAWFNVEGPVSTLSVTIADGEERTGVYFLAGFGF